MTSVSPDARRFAGRRLLNILQTLLLMGGMAAIMALSVELIFGPGTGWLGLMSLLLLMFWMPRFSPQLILRAYQARPLTPREAPILHRLLDDLTQRAGLTRVPKLYWLPTNMLNAFSLGRRDQAIVALSSGLLQSLNVREIQAVLAHELSHVANNDMRLMGLADLVSRMTHLMSLAGLFMALFSVPFWLLGKAFISPWALLILLIAPALSAVLQMALSRTREFRADLDAVGLTRDVDGLVAALTKLDQQGKYFWLRLLNQGYRNPNPSLLRSHPPTEQRIQRLRQLKSQTPSWPDADTNPDQQLPMDSFLTRDLPTGQPIPGRPKHGFWINIWR